jgi:chemotaxis protein MotB
VAKIASVPEPEKDDGERWLLTYADMITLLLALFIVLFATSQVDQVKFQQVATSLQRAFTVPVLQGQTASGAISIGTTGSAFVGLTGVGATIGEQVVSYALEHELGDEVSVTASRDAVIITLQGAMSFNSGSAELRPEARQLLESVVGLVRDLPDQNPIRVEGHTDSTPPNTGRFQTNWELSAARAGATARLLQETGIESNRLQAVGLAETRPIGDNQSPEGRAKNRRVEIWILPPEPIGPPAIRGERQMGQTEGRPASSVVGPAATTR